MKVVVIIPTYNEAQNIGGLIDALVGEFKKNPKYNFTILVVDGNSTDDSSDIVKQKSEVYPLVHLLTEEKKAGLGAAYIFGFKYAMNQLKADIVVEMDADFQHNPVDVIRLVDEIEKGNDYVIGSRFTKGGSIPKDWALYRKLLSVGGSLFAKVVLGIFSVSDFTSGFKATRVAGYLDTINLTEVLSGGFAYKIDLLFRMYKLGAKIKEIPIVFGLRDRGDSKMGRGNFSDSLKVVLLLRYKESTQLIRFLCVGMAGLFVDTMLFNILRLTLVGTHLAPVISGFTAMLTTFLLNNFWSFNDRKLEGGKNRIISLGVYIVSSTFPIVARSLLVSFGVSSFGDTFLISNGAFFIGAVFGLVWNFTVYSKIIWRKKD